MRAAPARADEKTLRRLFGALPVAALRLPPEKVYALSQTGLKRIDDILLRPRAPIAARFGAPVFARLDGLMGRAKNPITPRFEAPPYLVERRFAEQHGGFAGQRLAVLGLGKLGSREMSATSDLDLIFVYDIPPGMEASDGAQPLPPIQYYTRLSAKIVTALVVAEQAKIPNEPYDALNQKWAGGPMGTN